MPGAATWSHQHQQHHHHMYCQVPLARSQDHQHMNASALSAATAGGGGGGGGNPTQHDVSCGRTGQMHAVPSASRPTSSRYFMDASSNVLVGGNNNQPPQRASPPSTAAQPPVHNYSTSSVPPEQRQLRERGLSPQTDDDDVEWWRGPLYHHQSLLRVAQRHAPYAPIAHGHPQPYDARSPTKHRPPAASHVPYDSYVAGSGGVAAAAAASNRRWFEVGLDASSKVRPPPMSTIPVAPIVGDSASLLSAIQIQVSMLMEHQHGSMRDALKEFRSSVDGTLGSLEKRVAAVEAACVKVESVVGRELSEARDERNALSAKLMSIQEARDQAVMEMRGVAPLAPGALGQSSHQPASGAQGRLTPAGVVAAMRSASSPSAGGGAAGGNATAGPGPMMQKLMDSLRNTTPPVGAAAASSAFATSGGAPPSQIEAAPLQGNLKAGPPLLAAADGGIAAAPAAAAPPPSSAPPQAVGADGSPPNKSVSRVAALMSTLHRLSAASNHTTAPAAPAPTANTQAPPKQPTTNESPTPTSTQHAPAVPAANGVEPVSTPVQGGDGAPPSSSKSLPAVSQFVAAAVGISHGAMGQQLRPTAAPASGTSNAPAVGDGRTPPQTEGPAGAATAGSMPAAGPTGLVTDAVRGGGQQAKAPDAAPPPVGMLPATTLPTAVAAPLTAGTTAQPGTASTTRGAAPVPSNAAVPVTASADPPQQATRRSPPPPPAAAAAAVSVPAPAGNPSALFHKAV